MTASPSRIYLSRPHMGGDELKLVIDAFESNWIAPLGAHVDGFEAEFASYVGVDHAAALSSGTAALHLALVILGVGPGDKVYCPTLTFCASSNPIAYLGATPVFLDSERATWNLDPDVLRERLKADAQKGTLPKVVIAVDLYGQTPRIDAVVAACAEFDVPCIEDAAEALGGTFGGKAAGSFGRIGIFSFNGNKIITTSGGGMLVSNDSKVVEKARFLSTQARDPAPHYQHSEIGYNYRLSNVLAAVGRGQLRVLPDRVAARRRIFSRYQAAFSDLKGIEWMPEVEGGTNSRWLTTCTIDPAQTGGVTRETIRIALEAENIEARPVWKPLHLQPVFKDCEVEGGAVAESLFRDGLCLPSGSDMSDVDQDRVIEVMRQAFASVG